MNKPKPFIIALALIAIIVFWASAFVGIRFAVLGYSPGALALFRYAVASLCMLIMYLRLPKRTAVRKRDIPSLFILGVLGFAIYNIALNYGEISVTAGIASFIIGLVPVCMTVIAVIFLGERLSFWAWCGAVISAIGIVVIAVGEHAGIAFDKGVVYILIAMLSGALYSVGAKPLLKRYNAVELTTFCIWSGTLIMLVYLPELIHQVPHASWSATAAVIYMGIFPASIAYVAWSYVLANMTAAKAASCLYVLPLVTTAMGWALLSERPEFISFIGGMMALFGAIMVHRAKQISS